MHQQPHQPAQPHASSASARPQNSQHQASSSPQASNHPQSGPRAHTHQGHYSRSATRTACAPLLLMIATGILRYRRLNRTWSALGKARMSDWLCSWAYSQRYSAIQRSWWWSWCLGCLVELMVWWKFCSRPEAKKSSWCRKHARLPPLSTPPAALIPMPKVNTATDRPQW
ncbi:hypothetical protein CGCVW01_v004956 [Colletotrichum viniferum]|nr:hypothetical protein CGCVW01_v004956 [Colletotrichum viniferum]